MASSTYPNLSYIDEIAGEWRDINYNYWNLKATGTSFGSISTNLYSSTSEMIPSKFYREHINVENYPWINWSKYALKTENYGEPALISLMKNGVIKEYEDYVPPIKEDLTCESGSHV